MIFLCDSNLFMNFWVIRYPKFVILQSYDAVVITCLVAESQFKWLSVGWYDTDPNCFSQWLGVLELKNCHQESYDTILVIKMDMSNHQMTNSHCHIKTAKRREKNLETTQCRRLLVFHLKIHPTVKHSRNYS